MSKEKIRNLITTNQKKILATFLIALLVLLIVSINIYANNSNDDYAVEVKDDGALNIAQDENSSITKKIVEDTTKSFTYEVQVKNLADSTKIPEVAIVLDSSRSMELNDSEGEAKTKAIQLVTELLNNSPRTKISISSNSGVKTAMSKSTLATYTNAINGITYADGESVEKGIDYATSSFSNNDTDKYLIIFSDATDSVKDKIETQTNNGVEVFSMLTGITNSEYQSSTGSMGKVQMLSDISDFSTIYNKTNASLVNVRLTDIFSDEANEYFDFEIISKENDVEIEKTSQGYILKCDAIKVGETRTLKYKLTLKDNANIDAGKIYRTLNSSNNINIEYKDKEAQVQTYDITNSPTFVICKKYSLTIKAVSEKSNDLPVEDLDIKVVGTIVTGQDLTGNDVVKTIYEETLTTDSKGNILIDGLKTLGDINFEIKPIVNQFGYKETSATQIIVHNDPTGVGTIWAESDVTTPEIDVVKRNITVMLPISVATYEMEIETQDINDSRIILGNIEYRLIQPKLNSKYDMEALYGTADNNGKLVLEPAVMTKDGSYQYILTQMTEQDGYDGMGNVTLIVTFENGKVTKIDHKYNERVQTELISDAETKVIVGNEALNDNTFNLEINLKDDLTQENLFGAIYDILVTRTTTAGQQVTSELKGYMTDENGKINIDIPGNGYINLKITEKAPKAGYVADTVVKDITFLRKNGTVQYISNKIPATVNAIADSANNKVIVNLTSKLANEQNRIQVHLFDNSDPTINVPGVLLGINKVGEAQVIQGYTDRNGIANFIIPDEAQGSYQYEITLLSAVPNGYLAPSNLLGTITVKFNNEKHVNYAAQVSNTTAYMNVNFAQMLEGGYLYDTAKVEIGLEEDPSCTYQLKIALLDGSNMSKGVAGAKYSIKIESDGVEVKYLAGKLTDKNGNYTTRIIGGGQNITITINETQTLPGYIMTTTTQVIELELTSSGYVIANSSPNLYDPSNGNYIGAEMVGTELIYHDVNNAKGGANTILNLHVNKMDTNELLVSGVKVKLTSDTLLDSDSQPLDRVLDSDGNVINNKYHETDQNGYFEVLGIKVKGDDLSNGERIDYLYMNELDVNGNVIDNTEIIFKLTFRLNENTNIIEVTNVEATWGNRLVKNRTYSSRETNVAYESDIYLDLFTNFDDVGNFSLDLKKVNKNGDVLPGSKYDVVVMRPDSTTFVRRDININDNVELEGILVSKGTKIEITEKQAPIGYELNQYTEIITITDVNTLNGLVTCALEPSSYATPRAKISSTQPVVSSDGTYKLCVTLELTDYENDTFKLGIKTQDSTTANPVSGYSFSVSTSEGAQKNTPETDKDGKTMVQVGANYEIEKYEVTYKIETLKVANYYKKLINPIEVKIIFDINGDIISNLTYAANQSQLGYGTLWKIEATNTIDGNDIDILINIDPCDPLVVNIQTVDTINNQSLTNIEYSITPTLNLPGTGTTKLEAGYVLPDGMQTYTIKQTNAGAISNYQAIEDQQIRIVYDAEGNIDTLTEATDKIHLVSINGKQATVRIDIEPRVPFTIKNVGYFDNLDLANGKFEISVSDTDSRNVTTDINGEAVTYIGTLETDTSVVYTVKQTGAAYGYATVDEFQIEVFFDDNRNITDAKILGDVNKYVQFVEVTYTVPSTNTDKGYNENDKGIVNILIKNYPDVEFNIENVDRRDDTIKLAGTKYKIESSINTKDEQIVTGTDGIGTANLDKSGYATTITYTITELSPATRYQTLAIDAVIEVDFNNLGYIIGAPRVIKRTDIVTATVPTITTVQDNFKINLQIKSNPELGITITKVDEQDSTVLLPKVDFELTARISKDNLSEYSEDEIEILTLNSAELTEENYLAQVIDRLKINREDVEKIKQDIAIEDLINELKDANNLTAEEEDEIIGQPNNNLKINKIVSLGKATKTQVNQRINGVTNRTVLDKLVSNGTTTEDRINDLLDTVKKLVRLDTDNITTDSNGIAIAYMNKTLANKTIEYTLRETRKADGYDWLDEVIIFEVTYDSEGKMVATDPVKVVSGSIDITSVDQENFTISATVKNKPSDEVRIHLSVEDVYDSNKKLEVAAFDAYLVDTTNNVSFSPDNKYRVTLATGSATIGTSFTTAHGEDTETMGIYEEGEGGRILRLVQTETPKSYYIGDNKYESAYQSIPYALLVNVTFNDEGSITGTSVYSPGGDSQRIGYIADDRYIQVSHTRNTINITIKYYPMLQVQMQAVDMYTGASLKGNFTVDTKMWGNSTSENEIVSSGYINPHYSSGNAGNYFGKTYGSGYTTSNTITSIEDAARIAVSPIEADTYVQNKKPDTKERILYIYENAEPNSPIQYQTYLPRYISHSSQYLLAKIKVKYNDLGQVDNVEVLQVNSSNNIQSGFFTTVKATVNEHTIQIVVKYAPITTISTTVIDEVSGVGLSGIRINPYLGGNSVTSTSYEYRTILYYTTGNSGKTGWTYWGGSVADTLNRYVLDTYTTGSGYEGYFDPQNIILDVAYDENGRVASVTPKSTDQFGDVNAINISWENNNINVTIKYCRKFNVRLNKVDYNDSNKILNAAFDIVANTGTTASMAANTTTIIGKVYAGKTVKYTLSETTVPIGYIPVENLDILVEFNNDGSIRNATSTSDYYQFVSSAPVDKTTNSLRKVDLTANIKNKPRFDVSIELSDEFYPTLKLEGGTFTIENDKGEISSGGVQTDRNGILETYVGTVYPNEDVVYTVKQTSVIPGYYQNNVVSEFKVHFNANGKIENYTLINGTSNTTIHPTKHIGTQAIKLNITNKPKDIKVGIDKYDEVTNEKMGDIGFTLKIEEEGKVETQKSVVTNADGTVIEVLDEFKENTGFRTVKYTVSEIQAAVSYRKIQDVVIKVTYREDGSIYLYDVLSNPSEVTVEVATNKQIYYIGETPVHIKLTIPNDNAYDLIVKDEDINYAGLGIEGTVYDVSINGVVKDPITTNANGIAMLKNQTQTGEITITVTERTIGEGYRADNNNTVTFKLEKGTQIYSLDFVDGSNSNPTYATVEVDEEHGTVTVTFKNETKLELTMQKDDINTGKILEGAVFEIVETELDSSGNEISGTQNTITTQDNNTTDANGLLYFDLGLAKQNKTVKYTFTETTPPSGYDQILPINVIVKFDAYGHILSMTDDSFRAEETLASNTGKSHHMIVIIGNGTINEAYTVKIVTEDSQSGRRINGSIFQVEAIEESGATDTSVTGVTQNATRTIVGNATIFERGALRVTGVRAEGEVDIKFRQIETATGYVYGSNQTSGTVKINAEFNIVASSQEKEVTLSLIDNGGYNVSIDNVNREITIKILNDPQVTFEITKVDADTEEVIEGAKFNVTSAIVTNGVANSTGFSEDAKATDKDGYTEANAGYSYDGKTVIYTLSEDKIQQYKPLNNIILSVQYDTNGNIAEYKILSSKDDITIKEDSTKDISKRVITEGDLSGIVDINYSNITIPTGIGSRILQMEIKNHKEPSDYRIQIGKYHEDTTYPYLIPGAKYEITVKQEYGKATTTWTDITDENGIITSPYFSGHGLIEISITELSAPEGFKLDNITRITRLNRNVSNGKMVIQSTDSGCTFNKDYSMVYLKAVDEIVTGAYNIVINKVDDKTGTLIVDNPASIKLDMLETYDTITQTMNEETGEIEEKLETTTLRTTVLEQETSEDGRIVANNLKAPSIPGEYTYILSEITAPTDYEGIEEDEVEIVVTFEQTSDQDMVITNVVVKDALDVKAARTSNKLMNIMVYNKNTSTDEGSTILNDNEIGLDIRKVDTSLVQITTGSAEFKLTDKQTNEVTTITTDELGRAEIVKIKIPEEAGNYKYTLNETKAPKGYKLNEEDMDIIAEFLEDEDGKIYLNKVYTENSNLIYANEPKDGELPNRKIKLKVINEDIPYTVVIEKHHEADPDYPYFIPDVEFDIKVTQEYGTSLTEWTDITNSDGIIEKGNFDGYGHIRVEIEEKSTPDQYKMDSETKFIELYRDGDSKQLKEYDSNVNYELDEENQRIILKPSNEVRKGIYDLVINKVDKSTNMTITNNPTEFNLYMIKTYNTYVDVTDPDSGEVTQKLQENKIKVPIIENKFTDDLGILVENSIVMPQEEGVYRFELEEVTAPDEYSGLKGTAEFNVAFEFNVDNELVITDVQVIKQTNNLKVLAYKDQIITMAVYNEKKIVSENISLDITKVDKNEEPILTDIAVFKLTDNKTGEIYYKETSKENAIASILINKKTEAGEYEYTLNEIKAPEGYALDRRDITIKLIYDETYDGEVYLSKVEINGENIIYNKLEDGALPENKIELKVMNEEGTYGNANDKPYTLIINKIDSETRKPIKERATFDVSLVNGEIVHAATNTDGQIIIENVYMPSNPGEYEILIKEVTAPEEYMLDSEMKIVKATFDGTGEDMVISNIQLSSNNSKNIEIVEEQCTEDTIVLNILNKEEDLYLTSKVYKVTDENVERVKPNTTIADFLANMESNGTMKVYTSQNIEKKATDLVGTTMTIVATKGEKSITKTISVIADLDGNGRVTVSDLSILNQVIIENMTIEGVVMKSADIDENEEISVTDLSMMSKILVGKYKP